jgi:hypothetical protein
MDRIDPNEDFSDVNGSDISQFQLENEDPGRVYVWPEDTLADRQKYQSGALGVRYIAETYAGDDVENAVRPVGSRGMLQKGETVRVGTHVLMSCDRAVWNKRKRFEQTLTQKGRAFAAAHRSEGKEANVYAGQHEAGWRGLDGVNSAIQEQE